MKMEAKAHENERRVQLIIIEKKGDLMRSVSLRVCNAFALYLKVTLGLLVCTSFFYECKNCMNVGRMIVFATVFLQTSCLKRILDTYRSIYL